MIDRNPNAGQCVHVGIKRMTAVASTAIERLRLPLWLRFNGLVDLPEVAFRIGKVRRAQPPALVGWGSVSYTSMGDWP